MSAANPAAPLLPCDPFELALAQARYDDAERSAAGRAGDARLRAHVRIAVRRLEYDRVLHLIGETPDADHAAYAAFAAAALRRRELARTFLLRAGQRSSPGPSAESDYYVAGALWMLGDVSEATMIASRYQHAPVPEVSAVLRARFRILGSWIVAHDHQFAMQMNLLLSAIADLEAADVLDLGVLAAATQSLSALAFDLLAPEAITAIERLYRSVSWPDTLRAPLFQTLRLLAWAKAMEGDYITAFRLLDRGRLAAHDDLSVFFSHLDAARIALISQHPLYARAHLEDAGEYIERDLTSAWGDEVEAYLLAAELFAPIDVARAQRCIERSTEMGGNTGYAHDARAAAMRDYADARIRHVRGERRISAHRAQRALLAFESMNYQWRAARCALLLHALTGKDHWLERARAASTAHPRSFLAGEFQERATAGQTDVDDLLTPRQRDVLARLRQGAQIAEVARQLGMSPNTVRIHIGRIYRALGVRDRFGLLKRLGEIA